MADGYRPLTLDDMKTPEGVKKINEMLRLIFLNLPGDGIKVQDFTGYGSPENVVTAGIGSTYRRIDGGASTSLYVKESGTGNTGWRAV
jgi:hypothetical protein